MCRNFQNTKFSQYKIFTTFLQFIFIDPLFYSFRAYCCHMAAKENLAREASALLAQFHTKSVRCEMLETRVSTNVRVD